MRAMLEMMGENARLIGRTFGLMEVAEEEIARAKRAYRSKAKRDVLHGTFRALCPGILSKFDNDDLYRDHCREIIARNIAGEDLRPATCAECIAGLCAQSLKAPLQRDYAALYEELFVQVFGRLPTDTPPIEGSHEGATREILADMRRKLRVEERGAR